MPNVRLNNRLRPVSRPASPDVAFVLPGGGSAGAVQVGILRSLLEAGIRPDVLVGCSVGALNAAYIAQSPTITQVRRMAVTWAGISRADVFGSSRTRTVARLVMRHSHLYEPEALRGLIRRCCAVTDLGDLKIPVHVVTTDLDNGVARWWNSGPAEDILYASACLPGLLPPVLLNGHRHVDGGVLEPAPVQRAVDLDATTVYVLGEVVGPTEEEPPGRLSALDVLVRSFAISRYSRLPDPAAVAREGQRVIVVPGASTVGITLTDFSHTRRLMAESYQRSRRFLAELGLGSAESGSGAEFGSQAFEWFEGVRVKQRPPAGRRLSRRSSQNAFDGDLELLA
jgi:NTE family protein